MKLAETRSTLRLPDTGLPALDALINGNLWQRWVERKAVFPLRCFREGVRYVRLKPRTSCRLAVFGGAGREPTDPPPGFLLYLFPDLDRARMAFGKVDSRPQAGQTEGFEPFLCESSATVGIPFPHDPKIPGLRHVYRPSRLRRALVEMLPELGEGGSWKLRRNAKGLELLGYKPERRAVFRLETRMRRHRTSERRSLRLHLKIENPATGERSFANLEAIHDALQQAPPEPADWSVPRPLGTVVERSMMAAEWRDGRSLEERVSRSSAGPDLFHGAGRAIGGLHGLGRRLPAIAGADDEADRLRALGRDLAALLPDEEGRILELSEQLAEERLTLRDDRSCLVHGDFHLGQVLADGGRTVLVDFDRAGWGLPETDLGSFLAHLAECGADAESAQAFLRGYRDVTGVRPDPAALRIATACAAFRRSVFPFRDLAPDWPLQVRRRLDRSVYPPLP